MAYSINPNLPRARAIAMQLLVRDQLPQYVVANRCGVSRSTIWRWRKKWDKLNENVQFDNPNRPNRTYSRANHLLRCNWLITTNTSRPRTSPHAVNKTIVVRILELRAWLKRCAEVVWHHITTIDHLQVSLSSVRRILRRHHCFDGSRKNRLRPDNPRRPLVTKPGELLQTDTIHYICPITYRRRYVYTVIDLYSRMAYAEIHDRIGPGIAAMVITHAQKLFGFRFSMVQADNGPEFSRYFEDKLGRQSIQVRHSRLGRPNDNAHIERFNRTIQEECLGSRFSYRTKTSEAQAKIDKYIEFYNTKRVHLGLQMRIPAQMLQSS
jgi:transposase InsO family protein